MYLDWTVSGNLVITITRQAGANAVLNGLFLDPPSTATATLLEQDATTQGSWIGTYGAQGYDIVAGPSSLPANDTVTPSGQSTYTWTTTSSDPRALQVPGSSNRVAAVWYSATSFTVDVNLADGQAHDLELYFDDWDNRAGASRCRSATRRRATVLDTETISSFQSGRVPGLGGLGQPGDHDHPAGRGQCRPQRPVPRLSTRRPSWASVFDSRPLIPVSSSVAAARESRGLREKVVALREVPRSCLPPPGNA